MRYGAFIWEWAFIRSFTVIKASIKGLGSVGDKKSLQFWWSNFGCYFARHFWQNVFLDLHFFISTKSCRVFHKATVQYRRFKMLISYKRKYADVLLRRTYSAWTEKNYPEIEDYGQPQLENPWFLCAGSLSTCKLFAYSLLRFSWLFPARNSSRIFPESFRID